MILYGSTTSPYVRRIRILLADHNYQFEAVNVYEDETRKRFAELTPIKKLPLLVDEGQTVFDSHVIAQYLLNKLDLPQPSVDELNLISVVDAATDALIILFMGERSGIATDKNKLIFKLQHERLPDCLDWLNEQAKKGAFETLSYATVALISLIDWAEFRSLYNFSQWPELKQAVEPYAQLPIVKSSYPHV
ncbi:glutathione S-transferase family protein [Gayadomonas joobiniege]|uniref:glutathione S-transferase family protein n=1 Tax=Gayadomonas joobiniege TaxID=1234606 RepID=UPI00035E6364|nr:glutathione S-transferase N-terminal domain-containing protein [Gayadomonas joobiniege]